MRLLDPVIGDALRAVSDDDRAALAESERFERAAHRGVIFVGVAAQVIGAGGREAEDRPSDTVPAHRSHAVDDVVVGLGMPCAVDLGVSFVWPGSEREDGEGPLVVGHKEAVFACDVFLSVNPARVSAGLLSRIPIRLHERAGMLIHPLDKLEVVRRSNLNLHVAIIGGSVVRY